MKARLVLLFTIVITVSGCAEVAENSPGQDGQDQTDSENLRPTFEPVKAFVYNTGDNTVVVCER